MNDATAQASASLSHAQYGRVQPIYALALADAATPDATKKALRGAGAALVDARRAALAAREKEMATVAAQRRCAVKMAEAVAHFDDDVRSLLDNKVVVDERTQRTSTVFDVLAKRVHDGRAAQLAEQLNMSASLRDRMNTTGPRATEHQEQTLLILGALASSLEDFTQLVADWERDKNYVKVSVAMYKDACSILSNKNGERAEYHEARRPRIRERERLRALFEERHDAFGLAALDAEEREEKLEEARTRERKLAALAQRHPGMGEYRARAAAWAAKVKARVVAAAPAMLKKPAPEKRGAELLPELLEQTAKVLRAAEDGRHRWRLQKAKNEGAEEEWKAARAEKLAADARLAAAGVALFARPRTEAEAEAEAERAAAAVFAEQTEADDEDVFVAETEALDEQRSALDGLEPCGAESSPGVGGQAGPSEVAVKLELEAAPSKAAASTKRKGKAPMLVGAIGKPPRSVRGK